MPLLLYAARALPTIKRGYALIRKWNSLPPAQRSEVQVQARRAVLAIMAVKVAATTEKSSTDPPATWQAALDRTLFPGPAEEMAKDVVSHLQTVSEATVEEIATAVGAAGGNDSTLKRAMSLAREDGYIRRAGVTFRGIRWDTTEWADMHLLDTPHVRRVEEQIVAFVESLGLVSLDHISGELGLEDDAPELRAALERAISSDRVRWYCNGVYGLSPDRLKGFEPKHDLWAETKPVVEDKDVRGALEELESAVKDLARVMKADGIRSPSVDDGSGEREDADPYEILRRI